MAQVTLDDLKLMLADLYIEVVALRKELATLTPPPAPDPPK